MCVHGQWTLSEHHDWSLRRKFTSILGRLRPFHKAISKHTLLLPKSPWIHPWIVIDSMRFTLFKILINKNISSRIAAVKVGRESKVIEEIHHSSWWSWISPWITSWINHSNHPYLPSEIRNYTYGRRQQFSHWVFVNHLFRVNFAVVRKYTNSQNNFLTILRTWVGVSEREMRDDQRCRTH